jgi:phosphoglycerate dehydrogenase-like enzyme
MIAAARAIPSADASMRTGGFQYGVPLGMGLADKTLGMGRAGHQSRILSLSDFISIHMIFSSRSLGIVGPEDIARMKSGALLINTSRGPLVDERALVAAVHAGRIIAAPDVYDQEPLPKQLRAANHAVLTPISVMG